MLCLSIIDVEGATEHSCFFKSWQSFARIGSMIGSCSNLRVEKCRV